MASGPDCVAIHYLVDEAGHPTLFDARGAGSQIVDCFLWALQRFYEQGEDRYWETIRPRVKIVFGRDDTLTTSYGVYCTQEKPLTLAARAKK